jgi:hypothetical protein
MQTFQKFYGMVRIWDTSPEGFIPLTEVIANIWKLGLRRDTVMLESSFGNVDIRMLRNTALGVVVLEESPPSFETARESCIAGSALSQACELVNCSILRTDV